MEYIIFPPIGIARIGNSQDDFFIGPEQIGSRGTEIQPDGTETPVNSFKDATYCMKRQAARFHLFELAPDRTAPRPASLPDGTVVSWKVTLVNKKDAVKRPQTPPTQPQQVVLDLNRMSRIISATDEVSGPLASDTVLIGTYAIDAAQSRQVLLGSVRTDSEQRLIVLGGTGQSASITNPPAPIGTDFYNNPDWFDDVSDGPVTATVTIPGQAPVDAAPAWIITAPPDFAPDTLGVVTLYDKIYQVAIDQNWLQPPAQPYFETHIRPIIQRAATLRWVGGNRLWDKISQDWSLLSSTAASEMPLRQATSTLIQQAQNVLHDFELTSWQLDTLSAWENGSFIAGFAPNHTPAGELTRSALECTVGQGFFPGIEAGINITDPAIYLSNPFDFRFNASKLEAGDMTAHMALPWQADFLKCNSNWWPSQRPEFAPQSNGVDKPWLRPTMDHTQLVKDAMKLGVISASPAGDFIEQGRDPILRD